MSELPEGWAITSLGEIAVWGSGGTPSRSESSFYGGSIPWIKSGELNSRYVKSTEESITEAAVSGSSAKIFPAGSVAIAMYGATIGKTAILGVDAATNQACAVGIPVEGLTDTDFLYRLLQNEKDAFIEKGKGGAQPNISQAVIKAHEVSLPPLAEQTRIAAKLDELLAQVDTLKARIDGIPALLKRFRQSVLAAAVSGRLTEEWRIARIKSGEVDAPDAINLKKLSDICLSITDGDHQAPPQSGMGIPFITISAINDGVIRLEKATRYVPDSYYFELKESRKPQIGDILFSVTGSICIPAMVLNEAPFTFQRHIAILRPNPALVLQKFMYFYLSSEQIKKQGLDVATGTAQLTVTLKGLRNFDISLPSLEEQTEIVRCVEQLFAFADQLEARVAAAKASIDHLTQSILAKAFRGELVPQDPNDEPASVLLERIKAQRAAAPKAKRGRGKSTSA